MIVRCLYDKLVPIEELKRNPKNPNKHPQEQIIVLAKILAYQGWRYPIKVSNQSGFISCGEGRLDAAIYNKWTHVPVNYQDYDSPEMEYEDIVADNAIAMRAELDLSSIQLDLKDMPNIDIELLGIKDFSLDPGNIESGTEDRQQELNAEAGDKRIDELEELPPKIDPLTKPGDKFKIGDHLLFNGNCLEVLKRLEDNSIDSMVTDPPAGISFMGKEWDEDKGGSKEWIAWLSSVMKETLRVLKPGAHGFVWAIPRTSHWTAMALEDAGFEIRDVVTHIFGSGFPKSLDISKAIDKAAGVEREVIIESKPRNRPNSLLDKSSTIWDSIPGITAPATPEAKQWEGWGTALKPSVEKWFLVRKPMESESLESELWYTTSILGVLLCRLLPAKFAEKISTSSQSVLEGDRFASVQWFVDALIILKSLDPSEMMDMFKSQAAAIIISNIVKLWNNILGANLNQTNTYITKTKSSLIIELKTLNYLLSLITQGVTILEEIQNAGFELGASIAGNLLKESEKKLNYILTLSVQGNVGEIVHSNPNLLKLWSKIDHVIQTAPFSEEIILVRKPISENTIAENVLKHGTGGINIDQTRIKYDMNRETRAKYENTIQCNHEQNDNGSVMPQFRPAREGKGTTLFKLDQGRFPANVVLSHSPGCVKVGMQKIKAIKGGNSTNIGGYCFVHADESKRGVACGYGDPDGTETIEDWQCTEDCAVRLLDEQSGQIRSSGAKSKTIQTNSKTNVNFMGSAIGIPGVNTYSDSGGASRFFYCAKPSRSERNKGCEELPDKIMARSGGAQAALNRGEEYDNEDSSFNRTIPMKNHHPTVKPIRLMQYLITMITPADGTILDCFAGSGTTLIAAHLKAFKTICIEQSTEYCDIILARAESATEKHAVKF